MNREFNKINRNIFAVLGKLNSLLLELVIHPEMIQNPQTVNNISKKLNNISTWLIEYLTAAGQLSDRRDSE